MKMDKEMDRGGTGMITDGAKNMFGEKALENTFLQTEREI